MFEIYEGLLIHRCGGPPSLTREGKECKRLFIEVGDLWTTDTTVGATIGRPKGAIDEKQ